MSGKRSVLSLLAVTALATTVSGCSVFGDVRPAAERPGADSATVASSPVDAMTLTFTSRVEPLDTDLLGDHEEQELHDHLATGRWFDVPGASRLTAELASYVTDETTAWIENHPDLEEQFSSYTMTPELTAADEEIVAIRVLGTQPEPGAQKPLVQRTFWYDRERTASLTTADLFQKNTHSEIVSAVLDKLLGSGLLSVERYEKLSEKDPTELLDAHPIFDSVNFDAETGDLLIGLDEVSPLKATDPVELHIPVDTASSWLSETGEQAQDAVVHPTRTALVWNVGPDCTVLTCVALTFDDGPGEYTNRLLDILAAKDVPATFYVMGPNLDYYPEVVQRMVDEDHQVAAHAWVHDPFSRMSSDEVISQITRVDDEFYRITGEHTTTFRPPYGDFNQKVKDAVSTLDNRPMILWSVDTLDWQHRNAAKSLAAVKAQVGEGGIILMHDIHKPSVDAVPQIIDYLHDQGYTLVTVDQLLADQAPESGEVFTDRYGASW